MATQLLEQDIERLVAALRVLFGDVGAAADLSEIEDTQFARRAWVRAAFALIEGNLNLMANVILLAEERKEITLQAKDFEILRQERHTSDENGVKVVRLKFVPIRDRVAPLFQLFAGLYGKSFRVNKDTPGWMHFKDAIELRNRITHPKDAASFTISDDDLNTVRKAREWFADRVGDLLRECD